MARKIENFILLIAEKASSQYVDCMIDKDPNKLSDMFQYSAFMTNELCSRGCGLFSYNYSASYSR